jgi:hypothetical protein
MVEKPKWKTNEEEACSKRTYSMNVKSVVVGSISMERGLVAPQRTQSGDGAAGSLIKWNKLCVAALSSGTTGPGCGTRVRRETRDERLTNVAVVFVNEGLRRTANGNLQKDPEAPW